MYFLYYSLGDGTIKEANINRINNTVPFTLEEILAMYKECIENGWISWFPDEEKWRGWNKSLVYFNSNHWISSVHRNINYFRSNLQKMKYREGSSSHVYHSIRESSYNQNKTLEANQNNEK